MRATGALVAVPVVSGAGSRSCERFGQHRPAWGAARRCPRPLGAQVQSAPWPRPGPCARHPLRGRPRQPFAWRHAVGALRGRDGVGGGALATRIAAWPCAGDRCCRGCARRRRNRPRVPSRIGSGGGGKAAEGCPPARLVVHDLGAFFAARTGLDTLLGEVFPTYKRRVMGALKTGRPSAAAAFVERLDRCRRAGTARATDSWRFRACSLRPRPGKTSPTSWR